MAHNIYTMTLIEKNPLGDNPYLINHMTTVSSLTDTNYQDFKCKYKCLVYCAHTRSNRLFYSSIN